MTCFGPGPAYTASDKACRFVVLPAPFDATASYGTGARLGPARVLEASQQMELFDEELCAEPWKAGICTEPPLNLPVIPEASVEIIRKATGRVFSEQKIPVLIGGDHSVSIGALHAAAEHFGPIDILQMDAHSDLRDTYQGTRFSHACVMRRAWQLGNVIQAGIRSMSRKEWEFLDACGRYPVFSRDMLADMERCTDKIAGMLTGRPLYITIDVDCMDPSVMPATGTPEPGGISWTQLLQVLRVVTGKADVIGFDVVELAPIPGIHYPEFTVARLIYRLMGYIACQPRSSGMAGLASK